MGRLAAELHLPLVCESVRGNPLRDCCAPGRYSSNELMSLPFSGGSAIRLCGVTDLSYCGREIVHIMNPPLPDQQSLAKADKLRFASAMQ